MTSLVAVWLGVSVSDVWIWSHLKAHAGHMRVREQGLKTHLAVVYEACVMLDFRQMSHEGG